MIAVIGGQNKEWHGMESGMKLVCSVRVLNIPRTSDRGILRCIEHTNGWRAGT